MTGGENNGEPVLETEVLDLTRLRPGLSGGWKRGGWENLAPLPKSRSNASLLTVEGGCLHLVSPHQVIHLSYIIPAHLSQDSVLEFYPGDQSRWVDLGHNGPGGKLGQSLNDLSLVTCGKVEECREQSLSTKSVTGAGSDSDGSVLNPVLLLPVRKAGSRPSLGQGITIKH